MATKVAVEKSEQRPAKRKEAGALTEFGGGVVGKWTEFTSFLRDVRAEMRKVVWPQWKEVRVTTGVVIVTTFLFALYFFIVDGIFKVAVYGLLGKLGGMQ